MYGPDWDTIGVGHLVGLLVDAEAQLHLYVNGEDQGVAATDILQPCYALLDVYGQCEQVSNQGVGFGLPNAAAAPWDG